MKPLRFRSFIYFISMLLLVMAGMGGYFYQSTSYWERGYTEIRKRSPGTQITFLKTIKKSPDTQNSFWNSLLDYEKNYDYHPIDSFFIASDSVFFRPLPAKENLFLAISLADCVLPIAAPYTYRQVKDSIYYLDDNHFKGRAALSSLSANFEKKYIKKRTYLLGTDADGRDLAVMIFMGACFSLFFTLITAILVLPIGLVLGSVIALSGTWVRFIVQVMKSFLFVPPVFTALVLTLIFASYTSQFYSCCFSIAVISLIETIYLVSRRIKNYLEKPIVKNIMATVINPEDFVFQYILPNNMRGLFVISFYIVSRMMIYEFALTFLGVGIDFPLFSLSSLVKSGFVQIGTPNAAHLVIFPAIAIALMIAYFNIVRFWLLVRKH